MNRLLLILTGLIFLVSNSFSQQLRFEWDVFPQGLGSNVMIDQQVAPNRLMWFSPDRYSDIYDTLYSSSVFVTDTLGEIIDQFEVTIEADTSTRYSTMVQLPVGENGGEGWIIQGLKMTRYWISQNEYVDSSDVYTMRISGDGEVLWLRIYESDKYDGAWCIVPLENGGYIIGGNVSDGPGLSARTQFIRIDDDGEMVWRRIHCYMPGMISEETIFEIAPTSDDGVIAVGRRERPGTIHDMGWMLRLDSDGDTVRTRIFGEYDDDRGMEYEFRKIYRLSDDDFIVLGMTSENLGRSNHRVWALKIDEDCNVIWERKLAFPDTGETDDCRPVGCCELENGSLLICGGRDGDYYPFVTLLSSAGDSLQYMEWHPDSVWRIDGICASMDRGAFLQMLRHPPDNRYRYDLYLVKLGRDGMTVSDDAPNRLRTYDLLCAYPNPFNGSTCIRYYLDNPADIRIDILSPDGRCLETLTHNQMQSGEHLLRWNAVSIPSGSYICRLSTPYQNVATSLILVK